MKTYKSELKTYRIVEKTYNNGEVWYRVECAIPMFRKLNIMKYWEGRYSFNSFNKAIDYLNECLRRDDVDFGKETLKERVL